MSGALQDVAGRSLVRPAVVMAVGTLLSRLTGLGRIAALVYALGVTESRLADAYNIAGTLPTVVYELVLGGVLTSVFIPILMEWLKTREHAEAWRAASVLAGSAMALLLAVCVLTAVAAPWIIAIFSGRVPGLVAQQEQHELATTLLRLLAPGVALYGFAAIAGGLLNAHSRFAVPMFAPIVNNLVVIGVLLLFAAAVDGAPVPGGLGSGEVLLLGLGTTAGVAAMAAVYLPALRGLPGRLRLRVDFRHPAVRRLGRLSAWTFGYVVINQIGWGVSLYLVNAVQGGPTAYYTAFAFFQLPYGIIAVSIMTALVPTLASYYVDGDEAGYRGRLAGGLRLTVVLLVPVTVAYVLLSRPLIETLLERGVMGGQSSALVASTLNMFALGLLPFSLFALLMRAFYTRQDSRTPMLINVVANIATIALDFALFPFMSVQGLALAHTLGYVVGVLVAGYLLARRTGGLGLTGVLGPLAKVALATLPAAAAIVAVLGAGTQAVPVLRLATAGLTGVAVFAAGAWLLRIDDLTGVLKR
ncbi:murein biosynthesis integral membrane protein MurJ [Rhizohabitans arisaemae]|uniref:murein biosynthesis integral membrane protein MurJ n=1 Tax=Rhizohabitans arisaemae TaxID=2720610 RepID=UPI0024B0584B|nr:murein biosynthesis integral membrane protein MurJ [Rhizohabitans arisaemae]